MEYIHQPVLSKEVLEYLKPGGNQIIVDATIGLGGHSITVLERCPDCQIIGIDRDKEALKLAKERLGKFKERVKLIGGNFAQLEKLVDCSVDGILFDLGLSSLQIGDPDRGFSFREEGPLDMRMGIGDLTAERIVNRYSEKRLFDIISRYGEERWAKGIVRKMVREREKKPIKTTIQLAEIVRGAIPRRYWPKKIDPATRTFQALRMEVNGELDNLKKGLNQALKLLKKQGRIVVISFHSLEDRSVKFKFRYWAKECICPPEQPICQCNKKREVEILTRRPIRPTKEEIEQNPRSRSAKLRAIKKI